METANDHTKKLLKSRRNRMIIPANPEPIGSAPSDGSTRKAIGAHRFWGLVLVILGFLLLMTNLGVFAFFPLWHLSWSILFAILFIICGLFLIVRSSMENEPPTAQTATNAETHTQSSQRRLTKIRTGRKILGVCGGIAKYFDIDPSIVRILYVFFVFITHGFGIIIYFVLGLILPEEELQSVS
jgi:phage shock protein C